MIHAVHAGPQCRVDTASTVSVRRNPDTQVVRCLHDFTEFTIRHLLAGTGGRVR